MRKIKEKFDKEEILDEEELQILEDMNKGLYVEIKDEKYKEEMSQLAKNYLKQKKDGVFTIRTNKKIMEKAKKRAEKEGLNYQTLINMLIFKYANNDLNLKIEMK